MYIALMSHDNKKDLMVPILHGLRRNSLPAQPLCHQHHRSNGDGSHGAPCTSVFDLPARRQPADRGPDRLHEMDMVLFFVDPNDSSMEKELLYISRLCDQNNIPFASNVATAEMLVLGMDRGDLDWRNIVNPKQKYNRA